MKRTYSFLAIFFSLFLLALVLSPKANASHLSCGAVITSSVTLDSDIGPCPANGLVVSGANTIVIDLAGHSITGPGFPFGPNGINVFNSNNIEIKNGKISNFSNGIFLSGSSNSLIQEMEVFGNSNGISLFFSSNGNLVFDNFVHDNLLAQPVPSCGGGVVIEFNSNSNQVFDNRIDHNFCFGVVLAGAFGLGFPDQVQFNEVFDNEITNNLTGIEVVINANNNIVKDNKISNSQSLGIWVGFNSNSNQITDNEIVNSGNLDLFWDQTGVSNCWGDNQFTTSSPAILPSC